MSNRDGQRMKAGGANNIPQGAQMREQTTGADLITAERSRQVRDLGYTASHDDEHDAGVLAMQAAGLLLEPYHLETYTEHSEYSVDLDPWSLAHKYSPNSCEFKSIMEINQRIIQLTMAGALAAAEIDRLKRIPLGFPDKAGGS